MRNCASWLIASRCPEMTTEGVPIISTCQTADTRPQSRDAPRPSDAIDMPFETIERAQGMPGEGLTHGPPANKKQAAVTTGAAGQPAFPARWF
jgi:hypothetical protein